MLIKDVIQTCEACPSQWQAVTTDDRPVYIRYRGGFLSIGIGPAGGDIDSAVNGEEWFGRQIGNGLDGWITLDEVCRHAGLALAVCN